MPFFRIGDRLHYYAHVPKCAGSSVEAYLRARFGSLAFVDSAYLSRPAAMRWSRTSPQHVAVEDLYRLIPREWIASSFAVVRHPVSRLVSAFRFQAEIEATVPQSWSVNDFFDDWLNRSASEPFAYDNHLRPQSDLVPQDAIVFRLEDGLDAVVAHLDALAGNADGERHIPPENIRKSKMAAGSPRLQLRPETLARIGAFYSEDFRRFGYSLEEHPRQPRPAPGHSGFVARIARRLRMARP